MDSADSLDFLAIGDIVNDDFIDLKEAKIFDDKDGVPMIAMRFGDKLPYNGRELIYAVGNGPNAACSATRLGLSAGIMTHVGDDQLGSDTLAALEEREIKTNFVSTETGKTTNYHFVLRYNAERTILIKHEAYAYNLAKQTEGKPTPRWVYFSSVGEDSMQYHHDIASWVKEKNIKLAFQPGTFQIKLGHEPLKDIYEACELFFCNVEESERILATVLGQEAIEANRESSGGDRQKQVIFLIQEMRNLGPNIVCITDGPGGAYAYDGNEAWHIPMYPDPAPPVDRTGAGDSFSSTFTSALIVGKGLDEALRWGPINSMSVVQHVGAQAGLLGRAKLEEYLAAAPAEYVASKIL
jgi:sugar/nucleoside kinase (ribokinase family)